jgi:hypothetical protein
MVWVVELLDDRVRDELEALPPDMQARFRRIAELIQGYGLERVHAPCRGPRVRQENKEDAPARD